MAFAAPRAASPCPSASMGPGIEPGTRLAALDGLRGIAVAVVVLFHFESKPWVPGGFLGVDLFFTLSGFLITALVVRERMTSGTINLMAFYWRRILRLLPAYLFVWLVYLIAIRVLPRPVTLAPSWDTSLSNLAWCLVYLFNWKLTSLRQSPPDIAHFWSLCIEEQYYIVWPGVLILLLRCCRTRRRTLLALIVLAAGSCVIPAALHHLFGAGWRRLYYGTDAHMHGLLIGSACGYAHACGMLPTRWMNRPLYKVVLGASVAWSAALVLLVKPGSAEFLTEELPGVSLVFALLVSATAMLRSGGWSRFLTCRPLVYLGRRSYAIYLWHLPFAHWLRSFQPLPQVLLGAAASVAFAELSWRLVEKPAVRFRPRSGRPLAPGLGRS